MSSPQSFLVIARTTPYGNHLARAAIDLALTAAAFEQDVAMVFMDAGVTQLSSEQDAEAGKLKNVGNMLGALALYDVRKVYLHGESASRYGLSRNNCLLDASVIDDSELQALIASANQVIVF